MSDLIRTLAFAFRRKGAASIPGGDLRLLLAYDLRWFAPEDAKRAVARAVDLGLLREENGELHPTFDLAKVEIPLNFRPTTLVLEETPAVPPAPAVRVPAPAVPAAAPAAVKPERHAPVVAPPSEMERAADDERRKRGLLMGHEVARLIVRRRAGEDVIAEAAHLEARLLSAGDRSQA